MTAPSVSADPLRDKLANGQILFNAWVSLGSPFVVELVAESGADVVTIDQQHGIGSNTELIACMTAARAANIPALVRVSWNDMGEIGRTLDAGAQGVICPMINSAEDAKRFVQAVKYPPMGTRSWGPYRARLGLGDYFREANGWTIACAQIETKAALADLNGILSTPGLDMICAGPNDLAITLSGGKHADIRSPEVVQALDNVLAKCKEHGVAALIFANDNEYAKPLIAAGWQLITISHDMRWISEGVIGAKQLIESIRRESGGAKPAAANAKRSAGAPPAKRR
jgi:4-hydroxy-2-oxoheptanedioate aldolase